MRDFPPPMRVFPRCVGADPYCPCQDGDLCHYLPDGETPAFGPIKIPVHQPGSYGAEVERLHADLARLYAKAGPVLRLAIRWTRWRWARRERRFDAIRDRALARYFRS